MSGRHPPGQTLPQYTPPPGRYPMARTPPPKTATAADSTHPSGMHSFCVGCLFIVCLFRLFLLWFVWYVYLLCFVSYRVVRDNANSRDVMFTDAAIESDSAAVYLDSNQH